MRAGTGAGGKKKLENNPYERLIWRVLSRFQILPTDPAAQQMKERDFVWCLANMALDEEQMLARLCDDCRSRAESGLCPSCGSVQSQGEVNAGFDMEIFDRMRKDEAK